MKTNSRSKPLSVDSESADEVDFHVQLLCSLYSDVVRAFPAHTSSSRCEAKDLKTIRSRAQLEGLSFLTKTLPCLGRAVDYALSHDSVLQVPFVAKRKGSHLPNLLGWLFELVFTTEGRERSDASPLALKCIRQLCFSFSKLELPHKMKTVLEKLDGFIRIDESIPDRFYLSTMEGEILRGARRLVCRILAGVDPRDIIPAHGPGAVATGELPVEKAYLRRIYQQAENVYPYTEYCLLSSNHLVDRLECNVLDVALVPEAQAKITLVPKDSRGPRIISMEPLEIQWLQQGLKDLLYDTLEVHPFTRGHLNFRDQEINRRLAVEGSVTGDLVTLDMKDASDRVSLMLIHMLFPENWVEALEATRSGSTQMPDGSIVTLNKFAPMGSAVCFPVEALVFWALAVSTLSSTMPLRAAMRELWVYGDDIVCKRKNYALIVTVMEAVGLKFNDQKCCVAGLFRESCGMDAYRGFQVTPLRCKAVWRYHRTQILDQVSYVAYSNDLYWQGYTNAADFIRREMLKHCGPAIPTLFASQHKSMEVKGARTVASLPTMAFVRPIGLAALYDLKYMRTRWNARYQRREARCVTPRQVQTVANATDYEQLLECLSRKRRQLLIPREDTHDSGTVHHRNCGSAPLERRHRGAVTFDRNRLITWAQSLDTFVSNDQGWIYPVPHQVVTKCGWTPLD